jgi:tight adherence protein B
MLTILIIAGVLILVLLIVGVVISVTSEKSLVEERLGRYLQEEQAAGKVKVQSTPVGDWLNRKMEGSRWGGGVARELARADIKLRTGEYMAVMVLSGMGVSLVSWYFGGKTIFFALLGLLVGLMLPRMYVRRQQGQRLIRFNEQLPDMLNLVVNGLRAGFSTMQAMEAVNKEMPPPISDEFRRVVQEMQLGLSMERALDNLLRRIPSEDLDLTIAAINVQREVGGNLAEILDTISYTIRERVRIKGEIRVLTTQVVYSGRFLSLMPIMIVLALWFLNRPYMMMFFKAETRMIGIPVLGFGALMVMAGFLVMNKLSAIEV